eukprot:3760121-Rhodomonas_salina.2
MLAARRAAMECARRSLLEGGFVGDDGSSSLSELRAHTSGFSCVTRVVVVAVVVAAADDDDVVAVVVVVVVDDDDDVVAVVVVVVDDDDVVVAVVVVVDDDDVAVVVAVAHAGEMPARARPAQSGESSSHSTAARPA